MKSGEIFRDIFSNPGSCIYQKGAVKDSDKMHPRKRENLGAPACPSKL